MCFFRKRRERKRAQEAKDVVSANETKQKVKPKSKGVTSSTKNGSVKTTDKVSKYHVSQNKDPKTDHYKEWRIRKQGSNKTIKYFKTQKEAIESANKLAGETESTVVIHKLDGSIRKNDYIKK